MPYLELNPSLQVKNLKIMYDNSRPKIEFFKHNQKVDQVFVGDLSIYEIYNILEQRGYDLSNGHNKDKLEDFTSKLLELGIEEDF